jgi:4-amino-4-deoxy-L-arabinose transferase-like glycosyltransferase
MPSAVCRMVLSPRLLTSEAGPFSRLLPVGALIVALSLTTTLYVVDLEHTPVYFGGDEAHFAIHGHSLARTGRDLNGTVLPLFINLRDPQGDMAVQEQFPAWYQPVLFYVIALTLKVLPLNEVSVRLPAAIIGGLLSPLLTYIVARRLLKDRWIALPAMLVLALSPPLLILSRQALDYVCPIPFVLGWLWCLIAALERGGQWRAFLAGVILGLGFYSYIALWVFMPMCLVMTWVTYFRSGPDAWRAAATTTIGFLLPLGLLIPWAWLHPEMFVETAGRYLVGEARNLTLAQGASNLISPGSLQQMLVTYAGYFDPVFLFARGGVSMTTSTTRSGVFLLPAAVFLAVGLFEVVRRVRRDPIALVLLGGLLLAPIPALFVNERRMIQRELFMLPFAALIAGYGGALLLRQSRTLRRAVLLLVVAMALQFTYVYRDYFTHYKHRSAFYYDSVVFAEVADVLVAADPPAILLSHELDDGGPKWRFYATKLGRDDLLFRTRYVNEATGEIDSSPIGSLLVIYPDAATLDRLAKTGRWSVAQEIRDIDQRPASVVLRKAQ